MKLVTYSIPGFVFGGIAGFVVGVFSPAKSVPEIWLYWGGSALAGGVIGFFFLMIILWSSRKNRNKA